MVSHTEMDVRIPVHDLVQCLCNCLDVVSQQQVSKHGQRDVVSGDFVPRSIPLYKLPDDEELSLLNKSMFLAQFHIHCIYSDGLFNRIYIDYFDAVISI